MYIYRSAVSLTIACINTWFRICNTPFTQFTLTDNVSKASDCSFSQKIEVYKRVSIRMERLPNRTATLTLLLTVTLSSYTLIWWPSIWHQSGSTGRQDGKTSGCGLPFVASYCDHPLLFQVLVPWRTMTAKARARSNQLLTYEWMNEWMNESAVI